jgi:predicted transcriptional regulator
MKLKDIFDKIKKNSVYLKLLKFYHNNPSCLDTLENISYWIDEEKSKVFEGLEFLESYGFLIKHKTEAAEGYGYTQNEKLIAKIGRFLNEFKENKSR